MIYFNASIFKKYNIVRFIYMEENSETPEGKRIYECIWFINKTCHEKCDGRGNITYHRAGRGLRQGTCTAMVSFLDYQSIEKDLKGTNNGEIPEEVRQPPRDFGRYSTFQ